MRTLTLLALGCSLTMAAHADSLPINPGMWETTMNTKTPFSEEIQTETKQECVTETSFDPSDMMQDAEGCTVTKNELDGDTLDFAMECDMNGAKSVMTGQFQTDGETSSGHMDMNMDMGGMKMEMKMNWTGERIGDC